MVRFLADITFSVDFLILASIPICGEDVNEEASSCDHGI